MRLRAAGVILAEQLRQIGVCGLFNSSWASFSQSSSADFLFQITDQIVGRLDPSVEVALVGTDAFCFYCRTVTPSWIVGS